VCVRVATGDDGWRWFVLGWVPVLVLLSWIRTMKFLAYVTVFANFAIFFGLIVVVIASSFNMVDNFAPGGPGFDVDWWIVPNTFAIMIGMSIYAFEGIGVVLPCETAITKPHLFRSVMLGTLIFSTVNYLIFGLVPYLSFGRTTCDLITGLLHALFRYLCLLATCACYLCLLPVLATCACHLCLLAVSHSCCSCSELEYLCW
jgi:solute carrier family 36 (proton-coupled amino acid transporter)